MNQFLKISKVEDFLHIKRAKLGQNLAIKRYAYDRYNLARLVLVISFKII